VSSSPLHGEVYSIQHYGIKFVSDLRQVDGFPHVLRFPPTNKTDRHDITEISWKVALNTINQAKPISQSYKLNPLLYIIFITRVNINGNSNVFY